MSATISPRRAVPPRRRADVAQLVERDLPKVDVASSSLVIRSDTRGLRPGRYPRRGERVHRVPRGRPRLLRRPRDGQHQVLLGGPQVGVGGVGADADDRTHRRPRRGVRRAEGVPALPGRALRQGQDAVQDPPGRVRRHRPGHRLVRRGVRAWGARRRWLLRRGRRRSRPDPRVDGARGDRRAAPADPARAGDERASRSVATGSRPRRAGTTWTTPESSCCGTSRSPRCATTGSPR